MVTATDLTHVAYLSKQFGKIRSFALESLLHAALTSIEGGLRASTGHTLGQNVDAIADLLGVIRNGSVEKGLDGAVFATILARGDVDHGIFQDAEMLLSALQTVRRRIDQSDTPTVSELDSLFEVYTAFRLRTSGFLRQVEGLVDAWTAELEESTELRSRMSTTISDLEGMSGAINILAINASVEASRAREGGAAFRVIAQEMQRLSQQSSTMLKSTRDALQL